MRHAGIIKITFTLKPDEACTTEFIKYNFFFPQGAKRNSLRITLGC